MALDRLARLCYRRRWRVLGLWVFALIGVGALNRTAGGEFSNAFTPPGTESMRAFDLLEKRFASQAGDSIQVVFKARSGVFDIAVQDRMEQLFADIRGLPHVTEIGSPYAPGARSVAPGAEVAFATVQLDARRSAVVRPTATRIGQLIEDARTDDLQVEAGGRAIGGTERQRRGSREGIGLLAAVVILLVTFGSVIAMGLPILTAILGLGTGMAALGVLVRFFDAPTYTTQLATMIGLGVGIDYALFIVTRYRQALHGGLEPPDAVALALRTAGRSVVFAGTTVAISLMGMFLMGLDIVRGLAMGAVVVVALTVVASITLLPAVLGFAGRSIDRLRLPVLHRDESDQRSTVWFRWSRVVQRHPWRAGLAALVVLLTLAAPVLSMRLGTADARNESPTRTTRRAYDLLSEGFGPGFNGPLLLVAELPVGTNAESLRPLTTRLRTTEGVAFASSPRANPQGDTAVLVVMPAAGPQDEGTVRLVHRLRERTIPRAVAGTRVRVSVGGVTAVAIDMAEMLGRRLPAFMAGVIGVSFLLLLVVFRSLLVPLKAAIMNLLSIGASFGVVVAIFQWGWLADVVGLSATGPIEFFLPMVLFAILFGLSMDYEVFLLSRMREEYARHGNNAAAVADGLAATARVITAAAAIMMTVFLSFVGGSDRTIKLFGLGMAIAIFLDATVVRLVLVPATMELLGDANWWLPRRLGRVLPRLGVEPGTREDQEESVLTAVGEG